MSYVRSFNPTEKDYQHLTQIIKFVCPQNLAELDYVEIDTNNNYFRCQYTFRNREYPTEYSYNSYEDLQQHIFNYLGEQYKKYKRYKESLKAEYMHRMMMWGDDMFIAID